MNWEPTGKKGGSETSDLPSKKGKKKRGCLVIVALIVVVFAISRIVSCVGNAPKSFDWPTTGLATMLPKPTKTKGEINQNSDSTFDVDIVGYSESDYAAYVEQCKEAGFTVDAESDTSSFDAYTEEGHHLHIYHSESGDEPTMTISLDAPIEMGALTWPTTGIGAQAPKPASSTGKVDSESDSSYRVYVGKTDRDAYDAYVDSCLAAGFTVDYDRGDDFFYGDNADGNHISVNYKGFNTMFIEVKEPSDWDTDTSADDEPEPSTSDSPSTSAPEDSSAVSPDFKAMLDEYEAFMEEYVEFMKTYQSSSNTAAMLADYTSMMSRYAEMVKKIDDVDQDSLSAADAAYYLEVTARVAKLLAEVQ